MTAKAEYTAEEWQLLRLTPYAVGMAVVFSDGAGLLESLRESIALIVAEVEGVQRYPANELIRTLAGDRSSDTQKSGATADLEGVSAEDAPTHLLSTALADARRVVDLLTERSSEGEREGYLHWVMDVARAAALATRHGGVFSRGPLVDDQERAVLADVAKALGVDVGDLPVEGWEQKAPQDAPEAPADPIEPR